METIYINNGDNSFNAPITDSCERSHSLQQHNYVKLVWKSAENIPISANAYIEYEGQMFYALDDYFPTHKDGIYEYDIEFHSIEDTFNRPLFFRYVDVVDQATGETTSWKEIEWSLNGNLRTIAEIVVDCLNRTYNAYFVLPNDSYADTSLMTYSFNGSSIADALSTIAEQNETEWWLEYTNEIVDYKRKLILHFDKCELGTTIELNDNYIEDANGVWQSGGLKSVSQSGNTNIIPQKLFIYGSERNIIKKTVEQQVEGGVMNVSYDKKLRLPKTFPNTITGANGAIYENKTLGLTITLNEDSSLSIGGINNYFEQVKIFDDVYPKMDMTIIKDGVSVQNPNSENPIYWLKADRLKSITTENPVDGSINPGKLGLLIEGCTLMCTFTSGLLNGREFECAWRESSAEIGLIPIDENDVQIPSGVFKPQEGDTFILWNLAMPQSSIDIAQNELCVEAINYIEELATSITDTDCVSEPEAFRKGGYTQQMKVGQRISVTSDVFRNGKLASRIIKFSYKLTKPYDISFTLASSRQTGRLATLENMIADVTDEVHSVGQVQRAISRRQWHDTEEMMQMLDSIQKQMVVVGDENNAFATTCNVQYNNDTKILTISKGYLQHQSYTENEWKGAWVLATEKTIKISEKDPNGETPFYVYFTASKQNNYLVGNAETALPEEDDRKYVFVLGILSSEFEGKRIFNQTSGLTSIAGGTITTDVIQDPGRRLIIDYSNATIIARNGATIRGAIQFEKGEGENDLGTALEDLLSGVQGGGRNLLEDSEFADYSMTGYSGATVIKTKEQDVDSLGIKGTRYQTTGGTAYAKGIVNLFSSTDKRNNPNTLYTFSCYYKNNGDNPCQLVIKLSNDKNVASNNWFAKKAIQANEEGRMVVSGYVYKDNMFQFQVWSEVEIPIDVTLAKFQLEKGTIVTDWSPAPEDIQQAIADAEEKMNKNLATEVSKINGGIDALQKQVDGEVNSWFYEGEPTLNNAPVIDWIVKNEDGTTNEDETKKEYQRHEGDTYTDISEITLLGSWLWEQGSRYWDSGVKYDSSNHIRSIDYIENKGGMMYVPSGYNIGIHYYNKNKELQTKNGYLNNFTLDTTYPYYTLYLRTHPTETPIEPSISDTLKLSINPTAGQSWRWCQGNAEGDTSSTGWHWHKIADSDAVKALAEAGKAQATADGKSTTFVFQPSNYDVGDLWILAEDTTLNGTLYKAGTILTANQASETFVPSHWSENVKYTDDSKVDDLDEATKVLRESLVGSTEMEGGLVLTNTILLKDQNKDIQAGITGITTGNNKDIFAWAGGNIDKAVSGELPVILTRNGIGSKIGCFLVEEGDKVKVTTANGSVLIDANGGITMLNSNDVSTVEIKPGNVSENDLGQTKSLGSVSGTFLTSTTVSGYKSLGTFECTENGSYTLSLYASTKPTIKATLNFTVGNLSIGTNSTPVSISLSISLYDKTDNKEEFSYELCKNDGNYGNGTHNLVANTSSNENLSNLNLYNVSLNKGHEYEFRYYYTVECNTFYVGNISVQLNTDVQVKSEITRNMPKTIIGNNGVIIAQNSMSYFYVNLNPTSYTKGLNLKFKGLPISNANLEEGQLYDDGSGYLKINQK